MSATPESVGMNGERLARIDRFLAERYVGPGRLPCAQLLVARAFGFQPLPFFETDDREPVKVQL